MQNVQAQTKLVFLSHPQGSISSNNKQCLHEPASPLIEPFHRDYIHHLCMELQEKNKGIYIIEHLVSPKVERREGWQIISEQQFERLSRQQIVCAPIPFFLAPHHQLAELPETTQCAILFNQGEFCHAFIGFIAPDILLLEIINLLVQHFNYPDFHSCAIKEYPSNIILSSSVQNMKVGDLNCQFVLVQKKKEPANWNFQEIRDDVSNRAQFGQVMQIEDINASTGVDWYSQKNENQNEKQAFSRLWAQKKESEISWLKQIGKTSAHGSLHMIPQLLESEMQTNLEQLACQIEDLLL